MKRAEWQSFVTKRKEGEHAERIEGILEKHGFERGPESEMLTSLNVHYFGPHDEVLLVHYGRGNYWKIQDQTRYGYGDTMMEYLSKNTDLFQKIKDEIGIPNELPTKNSCDHNCKGSDNMRGWK